MTGTLGKTRYNLKQEKEPQSFQKYFLQDSFYAMEINSIGNHVTGNLYFLCADTYIHISLSNAFGNEQLTGLDLVHKLWNQIFFILFELLQSWLPSQNTLSAITTDHSNKLRCQKKISYAQLQKLMQRSCRMDGREKGIEDSLLDRVHVYNLSFPSSPFS